MISVQSPQSSVPFVPFDTVCLCEYKSSDKIEVGHADVGEEQAGECLPFFKKFF